MAKPTVDGVSCVSPFILIETADFIYLHVYQKESYSYMSINRKNVEIIRTFLPGRYEEHQEKGEKELRRLNNVMGIVGIVTLLGGPYLIVVTQSLPEWHITIENHHIYKLEKYEIIQILKTPPKITEKQMKLNSQYIEMLESILDTSDFYYSRTYDLTHNLQALGVADPDFFHDTVIDRANSLFCWNEKMLAPIEGSLHYFCVALIQGFITSEVFVINGCEFKFTLISRRSGKRPGTRLFSRGIDMEGHVSNFVETEQIIHYNGSFSSYRQLRGSIPLVWTQKANLRYKPAPVISQANHADAFERHFDNLIYRYGKVTCLNLINQSGSEADLGDAFLRQVRESGLENLTYEAFDFHHECRNLQWDKTDRLMNRIENDIEEYGFYLEFFNLRQTLYQEGIFRTNCIDCLDRTNVIQSLLGKDNFIRVLRKLGILRETETLDAYKNVEYKFKNLWADNGDACSIIYSGTGALKTDFTRTGKRTILGMLRDGYNSGIRYFKNNFTDGYRQDAMELFLQNYEVEMDEGKWRLSPLDKKRDWKYYTLPLFLAFSMAMWTSCAVFPQEYNTEYLLYMMFWGSMFAATSGVILHYNTEFVNAPVLMDHPRIFNYNLT